MAIKASFLPGSRALRDAAGSILINGGAVYVFGGKPTVAIYTPPEGSDRYAHVRATRKLRI